MTVFLSTSSPRLPGFDGTIIVKTVDAVAVGQLIRTRIRDVRSLVSYQATCDILAMMAGLIGIHRYNKDRDRQPIHVAPGDLWLICNIKDASQGKRAETLGMLDLEFTLCDFQKDNT